MDNIFQPLSSRYDVRTLGQQLAIVMLLTAFLTPFLALANTTETLTNSDASGYSSLTGTTNNWSPATSIVPTNALAATYDYYTYTNSTRTPQDGVNYNIIADSVVIQTGGSLTIKGYGTNTFNNLVLAGGTVSLASTLTSPLTPGVVPGYLAGSINLVSNSAVAASSSLNVGHMLNILATITNAPGVSATLTFNGEPATTVLSAQNTFSGNVIVNASSTSEQTNNVLQLGVNNAIPVTAQLQLSANTGFHAVLDLNGFNQTISNLFIQAGTDAGFVTNSAPNTFDTFTIGYNNGGGSSAGAIADNPATAGTIALTKIGTGTLNFGGTNTYSGDTTISNGTLQMGHSYVMPWGLGKGKLNIVSPGVLDMAGFSEIVNGLVGNGTIDNSGGVAGGNYHLTLSPTNGQTAIFSGIIQNTLNPSVQGFVGLILNATNATESLVSSNTFDGLVEVNSGQLWINNSWGLGDNNAGRLITVQDTASGTDAELHLNGTNGSITLPAAWTIFLSNTSGGGAIVNEAGNNTINSIIGLVAGGGSSLVTVSGGTLTLAGPISVTNTTGRGLFLGGAGNGTISGVMSDYDGAQNSITNFYLTMQGTGTWTLSNANIYSGPTVVNNGTLLVSGSLSAPSTVTVNGGTLGGSGTISGNVTVANASTAIIHPEGGSTLTLNSNMTVNASSGVIFDLTNSTSSGDDQIVLDGQGVLSCNGAQITINSAGTLAPANYVLFNVTGGGSISGTFSNKPAWVGLTPSNASSYGITNVGNQVLLQYTSSGPAQPHMTGISLSGGNLVISGTNGTSGDNFVVLTTTNVALPLSQWTPVATNMFGGSNFSFTNPINGSLPHSFYIIQVP
jgi:autotransporter-associated beta strand protein